ncbi:glycosyltransferase family 2 protein [Marinospirillum insulare]|uniref:Glycosyl transferase n=1 Tax=Marinospirillum insulare TaxID=217169 RepID=A0ABQ6A2A5_9GAMM|nr:glycosyltransferase family 2 protein [Marinospirillum insulare]GLR64368.1 glycosyl transferase [Marinospirillum insulare]
MVKEKTHTLSVCVITKNEADRIRTCLDSVKHLADEIVILDSGSTDNTVEIIREYTDQVEVTDWPGFGPQKQRCLEKAKMDWVLFIDADESLDATAQKALAKLLTQETIEEVAFTIKWGVVRHGKMLRFGRSGRAPLRLFIREGSSFSPDQVHEKVIHPKGKVSRLPGILMHHTVRNYGEALAKNAKYGWLGSQKYFERGRRNHSLALVILRSYWTFFHIFILRGGFLDGRVGLLVALDYMQTNFAKHAGLWTLTQEEKLKKNTPV